MSRQLPSWRTTHGADTRTAARVRALSAMTLAVMMATASIAVAEDTQSENTAVRFARADLVDVAMYVGDVTGKGFVLAGPELRTLSLSLYHPNPSAEALQSMFVEALETYGLQAIDRGNYWLIAAGGVSEGEMNVELHDAPMMFAVDMLAAGTGRNFVVSAEANDTPITIRTAGPMSPTDALALFRKAVEANNLFFIDDGDTVIITADAEYQRGASLSDRIDAVNPLNDKK